MTQNFSERANEREVVFGEPWMRALAERFAKAERVAVVTSESRANIAQSVASSLTNGVIVPVPLAEQHVPEGNVAVAVARVKQAQADAIVAYGGGSAIGLGKAIKQALGGDISFAAVVTTYSGSEMTDFYGILRDSGKEVSKSADCRPDLVIYDPELVATLPADIAVPSLFNAMAHAVDALYGELDDTVAGLAAKAVADIAEAVRALADDPASKEARAVGLAGAYRAATVLGQASMALQHKLAHVVAGTLGLLHAQTHTALLPHVIAYNAGTSVADSILASALDTDDAAGLIFDLASAAGSNMRLGEQGLERAAIADLADKAAAADIENPRKVDGPSLASLLDDARLGRRPSMKRRLDSPATGKPPHAGLRPAIAGAAPEVAELAIVLIHGRNSTAERVVDQFAPSIRGVLDRVAVVAPQADGRIWYPAAFSEELKANQVELDSALSVIDELVARLGARGVPRERIFVAGFSQGACLVLDYVARSGAGLAGAVAIAGGLIGADAPAKRHGADLEGVTVLSGVASDDRWIALADVEATRAHLTELGAQVRVVDHKGGEHTITDEQHAAFAELLQDRLS